jgi:nucleoside-triphosphate--adenylate kinase
MVRSYKNKEFIDVCFFLICKGYPRTLTQAEMLHRQMRVDHVIALNVPADEIVNRLKDRWVHLPSGRVYNLLWSPPKVSVS